MKRIIGLTCIISGLFMIGVGAYCGFELYDRYLVSSATFIYKGDYVNDSRIINIHDTDEGSFNAIIDGNKHFFKFDGDVYRSEDSSNFIIKFVNDELVLYIYPQNEGIYFQKIKN